MATINLQVAAGGDDRLQLQGGTTVSATDNTVQVGTHDATTPRRHWLWRWTNVAIPQGENIQAATVQLCKEGTQWQNSSWTWRGYATDNADQPTRIDTLAMTTANTVEDSADNRTDTSWYTWDVTDIVQEIVSRAGWASGNALALIAVGDGVYNYSGGHYYGYEDNTAYAAKLDITYGPLPPVNTPVVPEYVNASTNSATAATTSCALNKPANVKANDLLIAALCIELAAPTVTAPDSTWTLIYSSTPSGTSRTHRQITYWKKLDAADEGTSSWTWTVTTGYEWAGCIVAYRNAAPPVTSAASTTNSSSASATAPTVSTERANAMVLHVASNMYGTTWTPPSSPQQYTERVDVRSSTGTSNISLTLSESLYAAAGATGTVTATAANADYYVAGQIVLEVVATERAMVGRWMPPVIDVWR